MLPRRVPGATALVALCAACALATGACAGPGDGGDALGTTTAPTASSPAGGAGADARPPVPATSAGSTPPTAEPGPFVPGRSDVVAVERMLDRRARAVRAGDRAAFEATVDDRDPEVLDAQRHLFDNLAQLPLTSFSYEVDGSPLVPDTVPGRAADDPVLRLRTVERVGIAGALEPAVGNETRMTFVRRGSRWLVGRELRPPRPAAGVAPPRPWFGDAVVATTRGDLLVLADAADVGLVDRLADMAAAALDADARLLGVPTARNLLVDATSNGRAVRLGPDAAGEAAALYSDVYDLDARGRPTRRSGGAILVNPGLSITDLTADPGLLRHELTHFLLREHTATAPLWASEGIAEHVRWNPLTLADLRVPASTWQRLRATRGRLPADDVFWEEPSVNYLVAQAAVQHLLDLGGQERFADLLRRYRTRADVGATKRERTEVLLPAVYRISRRELADAAWRNLRTLDH